MFMWLDEDVLLPTMMLLRVPGEGGLTLSEGGLAGCGSGRDNGVSGPN